MPIFLIKTSDGSCCRWSSLTPIFLIKTSDPNNTLPGHIVGLREPDRRPPRQKNMVLKNQQSGQTPMRTDEDSHTIHGQE